MTEIDVRNWVHDSVESFFKGEETLCEKYNIRIVFDYDDDDGFWGSEICVRQKVYGKWEICKIFKFQSYYANYWVLATDPWVCDMITDITKEVMKFIEEPKKKEW